MNDNLGRIKSFSCNTKIINQQNFCTPNQIGSYESTKRNPNQDFMQLPNNKINTKQKNTLNSNFQGQSLKSIYNNPKTIQATKSECTLPKFPSKTLGSKNRKID